MDIWDVLVIGAGPAGLAAAIRVKQHNRRASVLVLDKAPRLGGHSLSGAAFETACLDALLPGWRTAPGSFVSQMIPVERDEMYFLTDSQALRVPPLLVPPGMHHEGDRIISLARLVEWLGSVAVEQGVEVFTGLSAAALIWEGDTVKGVRLVDQGLDKERKPKANFQEGEEILARTVVLADGARGVLSREYIARAGEGKNPQVYSVGIKEVFRLPEENSFGQGRIVHTLGFPSRPDVFGGGFLYSMGKDLVAAGLILGLDWPYTDLDIQKEMQIFKAHPFVAGLLKEAVLIEAGAKTIPEGGFFAMPKLFMNGAVIVGDAAGLVNMEKIKGIHYAVFSGMAAADAIAAGDLAMYPRHLEACGVMRDMRGAKNFRALFQAGLFFGAPLSLVQGLWPWRIAMPMDHTRMQQGKALQRQTVAAVNRADLAALSGTIHREDEPSHLIIPDAAICQRCHEKFQSPCTAFCPTEVYARKAGAIHISATNCLHCGTCAVKCPFQNITWTPPEGGEGPRYKMM